MRHLERDLAEYCLTGCFELSIVTSVSSSFEENKPELFLWSRNKKASGIRSLQTEISNEVLNEHSSAATFLDFEETLIDVMDYTCKQKYSKSKRGCLNEDLYLLASTLWMVYWWICWILNFQWKVLDMIFSSASKCSQNLSTFTFMTKKHKLVGLHFLFKLYGLHFSQQNMQNMYIFRMLTNYVVLFKGKSMLSIRVKVFLNFLFLMESLVLLYKVYGFSTWEKFAN